MIFRVGSIKTFVYTLYMPVICVHVDGARDKHCAKRSSMPFSRLFSIGREWFVASRALGWWSTLDKGEIDWPRAIWEASNGQLARTDRHRSCFITMVTCFLHFLVSRQFVFMIIYVMKSRDRLIYFHYLFLIISFFFFFCLHWLNYLHRKKLIVRKRRRIFLQRINDEIFRSVFSLSFYLDRTVHIQRKLCKRESKQTK